MTGVMQGRTALVTGAASGIGAAVARRLSGMGAQVVLLDIAEAPGQALADELDGRFIRCDVSRRDAWFEAVATCLDLAGTPDYVHLNAGVMSVPADEPFVALEDLSEARYRRIVDVNLGGVVYGLQALLPHLRGRPGAICVTASMVGLVPLPVDPMYAATKHALVGLVRSLAAAEPDAPLRINAICPGGVDTAIVPQALRAAGIDMLSADSLAVQVVDLLTKGANGEIRLCLAGGREPLAVPAPAFD